MNEMANGPTIQTVMMVIVFVIIIFIIWRLVTDDKLKRRLIDSDSPINSKQLIALSEMNSENTKLSRQMLEELKAIHSLLEKNK